MYSLLEIVFGSTYGSILIIPFISPKDLFTLCYVSKSIKQSIYNSPKRFSDHHAVDLITFGETNFPVQILPPINARQTVKKIAIPYYHFTSSYITSYISFFPKLSTIVFTERISRPVNILYMQCVFDLTKMMLSLPATINRCCIKESSSTFLHTVVNRSIRNNANFIEFNSTQSIELVPKNIVALKIMSTQFPNDSNLRFLHIETINRNNIVLPNLKVLIIEPICMLTAGEFTLSYYPSIVHLRIVVDKITFILTSFGSTMLETLEIQLLSWDSITFYNNSKFYSQVIQFFTDHHGITKDRFPRLSNISLAWYGFKKHEEVILDDNQNPWITFKFIRIIRPQPSLDSTFSHLTGTSDQLKEAQISQYLIETKNT